MGMIAEFYKNISQMVVASYDITTPFTGSSMVA